MGKCLVNNYKLAKINDAPEQILLQHSHSRHHPRFSTGAQTMQFHIRADHCGRKFCISSRACTAATYVLCNVVDLPLGFSACRLKASTRLTFSQFLSATIGPSVALVSAPNTIPSLNRHPTMVVPVLVALGRGMPFSARKVFLPTNEFRLELLE
jgi:hypothetical protein